MAMELWFRRFSILGSNAVFGDDDDLKNNIESGTFLIGLVFKNDSKDKQYTMQVYSSAGKLKFSKDFNIPYTTIRMSDDYIVMYNSSQLCVLNSNGSEKYFGSVDGTVKDFFKLGWNKYLLVMDTGVNVIKLS